MTVPATAPTFFTMNVTGAGGTTTLVTVNMATTTTLNAPGTSSPSLSAILAGDHGPGLGHPGRRQHAQSHLGGSRTRPRWPWRPQPFLAATVDVFVMARAVPLDPNIASR